MGRIATIFIGFALVTGVMLTGWGLVHMPWPKALPWSGTSALSRYLIYLGICTVLVIGGSYWSRRSSLLVGVAIAAGFALLSGAVWPLFVTLWFFIASALLGRSILTGLRIRVGGDSWQTNFLVGAGVYGTVVGLLAHFPVNYPGLYGAALALPLLLSWRVVAEKGRSLLAQATKTNLADYVGNKLEVAIAVLALVYLVVALMPEVGHDALATHLFVPAHLAERHHWSFDVTTYVWAVMPMLGDWIYSIGYMLAGESAARLINVGFIFVLGWLVRDVVLWAGGTTHGARWAVLIFLSTPLSFTEGSSLYIESVWASFIVAGTLAVLMICTRRKAFSDFAIAGLMLGCALAAKAVTFTVLPVLLLFLVWCHKTWFRLAGPFVSSQIAGSVLLGLSLLVVFGIAPYATAWALTGNPVFPFFNKIFLSPYFPPSNFDAAHFGKGLSWDFLYTVTFQSGKYLESLAGGGGFQWLLLFLPVGAALLSGWHKRGITLLLFGIIFTALVFNSTAYLRYIFPAYAVLAAAMGVGLTAVFNMPLMWNKLLTAVAVLAVILNIIFLNAGAFYSFFPLGPIFSGTLREQYFTNHLPIRNAVHLVNTLNVDRSPVAVFAHPMTAGLKSDALYANWYNQAWADAFNATHTELDLVTLLRGRQIAFLIIDSSWNLSKDQIVLLEKVSEEISRFGSITVRRLRVDYRYKIELLTNPDFSDLRKWGLVNEAARGPHSNTVIASVDSLGMQVVAVKGGQRYKNSVVARCYKEKAKGRIQVNWNDAEGKFIKTDIRLFDCWSEWEEQSMEVVAPPSAVNAVIYVAGHTSAQLEFKSASFKQ